MQVQVPIDTVFDRLMVRRAECRELVSAMFGAAVTVAAHLEQRQSAADHKRLALRALKQAPDCRLDTHLRRVKAIGRMLERITAAKRAGAQVVWLTDDEVDVLA